MSELFEEIKEDIRRERFEKLWNSFGKIMVGISIAVIVATVAIVVDGRTINRRAPWNRPAQFIKGVDRMNVEDYKGAVAAFDALTTDERSPYYGLAMLRKAQAQNCCGDKDGAAQNLSGAGRRMTPCSASWPPCRLLPRQRRPSRQGFGVLRYAKRMARLAIPAAGQKRRGGGDIPGAARRSRNALFAARAHAGSAATYRAGKTGRERHERFRMNKRHRIALLGLVAGAQRLQFHAVMDGRQEGRKTQASRRAHRRAAGRQRAAARRDA